MGLHVILRYDHSRLLNMYVHVELEKGGKLLLGNLIVENGC